LLLLLSLPEHPKFATFAIEIYLGGAECRYDRLLLLACRLSPSLSGSAANTSLRRENRFRAIHRTEIRSSASEAHWKHQNWERTAKRMESGNRELSSYKHRTYADVEADIESTRR